MLGMATFWLTRVEARGPGAVALTHLSISAAQRRLVDLECGEGESRPLKATRTTQQAALLNPLRSNPALAFVAAQAATLCIGD